MGDTSHGLQILICQFRAGPSAVCQHRLFELDDNHNTILDDQNRRILMRHGRDAWCRRYMPYLQIDYTLMEAGQMYQSDRHRCDFWIEHDGKQIRPWLTAVQDLRSRLIVGWHLGPRPHQDAILSAYLMAFGRWAIPERIGVDNGLDYTSRLLTGVTKSTRAQLRKRHGPDWARIIRSDDNLVECVDPRFLGVTAELGVELIYAIPYAPGPRESPSDGSARSRSAAERPSPPTAATRPPPNPNPSRPSGADVPGEKNDSRANARGVEPSPCAPPIKATFRRWRKREVPSATSSRFTTTPRTRPRT